MAGVGTAISLAAGVLKDVPGAARNYLIEKEITSGSRKCLDSVRGRGRAIQKYSERFIGLQGLPACVGRILCGFPAPVSPQCETVFRPKGTHVEATTMKANSGNHLGSGLLWIALLGVTYSSLAAESPVVIWERIEGIDPISFGQQFGGISAVTIPWSTTNGKAILNLESGRLQVHVEGLSVGAGPTPLVRIGSTGVVEAVRATVMCHQTGEFVDSEATELSSDGDAMISGHLDSLPTCDPIDLILLVRIAAVAVGGPPVTNLWLAHGAARKIR